MPPSRPLKTRELLIQTDTPPAAPATPNPTMPSQTNCFYTLLFVMMVPGIILPTRAELDIPNALTTIRASNSTSLSEKIQFRHNSSVEIKPYPPKPGCENLLDAQETQYPISVSIWKLDLSDTSIQGIMMWSEEVITTCSFGFFGVKSTNTLGTSIIPFQTPPSSINFSKYLMNPIDEIVEDPSIPWEDRYNCYYCRNEYPGSYKRNLYKRVIISRYPDGSIRSPIGGWEHITRNLYSDGRRYLYISYNSSNTQFCPFKVHDIRYGVLTLSSTDTMIISLPSVKQQYSIPSGSDSMDCSIGSHNSILWHTAGGYVISFSGEGIPYSVNVVQYIRSLKSKKRFGRSNGVDIIKERYLNFQTNNTRLIRRSTDPMEFSSGLRSDLIYAQFRFEMDFILKQINKNLILIQNHICDFLHMKWTTLYPPDLPRKVAQYISFSSYSVGEFKDGLYRITSTILSNIPIALKVPLVRQFGMYEVTDEHNNKTLWVEPITGILFKDPHWTHYSMVASWLPLQNGTGIDPLTGKTIIPSTANTPITLVEQAEEYYPQVLYSQGSLSGIIEDNVYYNSPASPSGDSSIQISWWTPWIGHIIIGIISIFLSLILTPALLKLLSACALKGEKVVEETLHLERYPSRPLIPKHN